MDRVVNMLNNRYLLAVMALLFVIGVMRRIGR